MSLRDRLVNAPSVFRHKTIDVPEWDCKFEVRALSVDAKMELGKISEDADTSPADVMVHLLVSCVFDPDTGEQVFTDADSEWIRQQDSSVVEAIGEAALGISGLVAKALDIPKDDSSKMPNTAMSSSEPNG